MRLRGGLGTVLAMTRTAFDYPADTAVVDERRMIMVPWGQWLTLVNLSVNAQRQSGTTAQRPTDGLWIGRQFYDLTLNKPVYVSAVRPTVWRDASGAPV